MQMRYHDTNLAIVINQSLLSPISSPLLFKTKKGENVVFVQHFYGRFLSISSPTMAIAMIMATVEMVKYISVGGKLTTGYGDAVGAACITAKAFCEDDGQ